MNLKNLEGVHTTVNGIKIKVENNMIFKLLQKTCCTEVWGNTKETKEMINALIEKQEIENNRLEDIYPI